MIVTIDTDKKEILIEEATMNELYEYVAKFNLLNYTVVSKQTYNLFPIISGKPYRPNTDDWYVTCNTSDIDKAFKTNYNII